MKKDPKLIFLPVPVALQYRDYLASRSFFILRNLSFLPVKFSGSRMNFRKMQYQNARLQFP